MEKPIDIDAAFDAIKRQRDTAMNEAAMLVGRVTLLERQLAEALEELRRRPPPEAAPAEPLPESGPRLPPKLTALAH